MKKIFIFLGFFLITEICLATPFHPLPSGISSEETNPLYLKKFEDLLSDFYCSEYKVRSFDPKETDKGVKKSQVVKEIFLILSQSPDIKFPLNSKFIKFFDISEKDDFFVPAQALRSLHILETPTGYFGKKGKESDPIITIHETEEMLHRAFVQGQCNFMFNTDPDFDGVEGIKDACPNVPEKGSSNGCPQITFSSVPKNSQSKITVSIPREAKALSGISFAKKIQIKKGDFFKTIFMNPKTNKILKESNIKKVEQ